MLGVVGMIHVIQAKGVNPEELLKVGRLEDIHAEVGSFVEQKRGIIRADSGFLGRETV